MFSHDEIEIMYFEAILKNKEVIPCIYYITGYITLHHLNKEASVK